MTPPPGFDRGGLRYRQVKYYTGPGVLYRWYPPMPFDVDGIQYTRGLPRPMIEIADLAGDTANCYPSTPMTEEELTYYTHTGRIPQPTA